MQSFKVLGLLAFVGSISAGAVSYIEAQTGRTAFEMPPAQSRQSNDEVPEPPLQVKDASVGTSELNNRYGW